MKIVFAKIKFKVEVNLLLTYGNLSKLTADLEIDILLLPLYDAGINLHFNRNVTMRLP